MTKSFDRALVALDLSKMDTPMLRYLAGLVPVLGIKRLYFLHVMPDFSSPTKLDVEFHKLFNPEYPVDERVRDKLQLDIQEALGDLPGLEWSVEVREGKPYQKLIHWIEVKEVDLLIVGKKQQSEGSGITAKRVARHTDCHVLFVPPDAAPRFEHLIVPIDFSENAYRALQVGLDLKHRQDNAELGALYIVEMPLEDYYVRGALQTGYRGVLMESAQTAYNHFIQEHRLNDAEISPIFVQNDYGNISSHLAEYLEEHPTDLVIQGAQGHSAFENFLYGSVTEKLLDKLRTRPILIIR